MTHKWYPNLGQSGPCSDGNEGVLHIPQNLKNGASLRDTVLCHTQDIKYFCCVYYAMFTQNLVKLYIRIITVKHFVSILFLRKIRYPCYKLMQKPRSKCGYLFVSLFLLLNAYMHLFITYFLADYVFIYLLVLDIVHEYLCIDMHI